MYLGMTYSPTVPGGGAASYKLRQCLHIIMAIGKCTAFSGDFFLVLGVGLRGRSSVGGSSLGEICHGGTEIQ